MPNGLAGEPLQLDGREFACANRSRSKVQTIPTSKGAANAGPIPFDFERGVPGCDLRPPAEIKNWSDSERGWRTSTRRHGPHAPSVHTGASHHQVFAPRLPKVCIRCCGASGFEDGIHSYSWLIARYSFAVN